MDTPVASVPAERRIRSRRLARCAGCRLSHELCLCAMLAPMAVRTRVIVVMHRNEAWKTSNTGRLAVRALAGAELRVRGATDARDTELDDPPLSAIAGLPRRVLFPVEGARVLDARDAAGPPGVLIVPDGTWTQARKLMRRHPLAAGAEPVTLPAGPASRYRLRRNERDGGLCTLEALARALGVLEGPAAEAHLLGIFEAFVARLRFIRGLHREP